MLVWTREAPAHAICTHGVQVRRTISTESIRASNVVYKDSSRAQVQTTYLRISSKLLGWMVLPTEQELT